MKSIYCKIPPNPPFSKGGVLNSISLLDIGLKPYEEVLGLQENLQSKRLKGLIDDTIIFCEHPPVYTVGKQDCSSDFLSSNDDIRKDGIDVVKSNRGGRVTYHGPGQIVVYFILKIEDYSSGVKGFVSKIEDICIDFISGFGLKPVRKKEYPGIWIDNNKIAAIGLHISHGVSMHGMAINIDPDLRHYSHIVPCGIRGYGVTSLKKEGCCSSIGEVKDRLVGSISVVLNI